MNAFIITGAPGSGKTAIINRLMCEGFNCLPEIPRILIKEKTAEKMGISPFKDLDKFFALVFNEMLKQYLSISDKEGVFFFDRSMPDVLGYCYKFKVPFPIEFQDIIVNSKFEKTVFFCPPWQEIYKRDEERPYTFEEVKILSKNLYKAYTNLGFHIEVLPETNIQERTNYIKDKICTKN